MKYASCCFIACTTAGRVQQTDRDSLGRRTLFALRVHGECPHARVDTFDLRTRPIDTHALCARDMCGRGIQRGKQRAAAAESIEERTCNGDN